MLCFKLIISWAFFSLAYTNAFAPHPRTANAPISTVYRTQQQQIHLSGLRTFSSSLSASSSTLPHNLVVISPPGGIGEVAAVQAAKMGSSVKWFVISPPLSGTESSVVSLSAQTFDSIQNSKGGSLEVAGARADTLLLPIDDAESAVRSLGTWCSSASVKSDSVSSLICVLVDGAEQSIAASLASRGEEKEMFEKEKMRDVMMDAIKVAAKEVTSANLSMKNGMKIAVLPANMEGGSNDDDAKDSYKKRGAVVGGGFLEGVFGGGSKVEIPSSLLDAFGYDENVATLRYGELFGIPESSPDASPFVGGPRRYPVLRDEYTFRGIRMDPSRTSSGNQMMGENSRSSRLAVGEAAVRMTKTSMNVKNGADVCLTSLRGMDLPSDDEWAEEFSRAQEALEKNMNGELFSASFGSVKSLERLSDWLATKWAPAVLKTYDIAGIRVGARPVYASRIGENQVEIVWQELKDFKTTIVGKMIIQVFDNGLIARRAAGDANAGYGTISSKPLAGEDILVRRLAEAATQAVEKGLATKPVPVKRPKKQIEETPVITTVVSTGVVESTTTNNIETVSSTSTTAISEAGPRTSGARRPSERKRGKRRNSDDEEDE